MRSMSLYGGSRTWICREIIESIRYIECVLLEAAGNHVYGVIIIEIERNTSDV